MLGLDQRTRRQLKIFACLVVAWALIWAAYAGWQIAFPKKDTGGYVRPLVDCSLPRAEIEKLARDRDKAIARRFAEGWPPDYIGYGPTGHDIMSFCGLPDLPEIGSPSDQP